MREEEGRICTSLPPPHSDAPPVLLNGLALLKPRQERDVGPGEGAGGSQQPFPLLLSYLKISKIRRQRIMEKMANSCLTPL